MAEKSKTVTIRLRPEQLNIVDQLIKEIKQKTGMPVNQSWLLWELISNGIGPFREKGDL